MNGPIFFSSRAMKNLAALAKTDRFLPEKIRESFALVAAGHMQNVKRLEGEHAGMYRLRIGVFRVLFTVEPDCLLVVRIAHRKESYR